MCKNCSTTKDKMHYKTFSFAVNNTKTVTRDGDEFGIVKGYASTYGNVDRGNEIVARGAFAKSLARYKESDRKIRMFYQHNRENLIGGFPIDQVVDDEKGLLVTGEINLSVPQGKAAYALAKQGVLTDFSIGYGIIDAELASDGVFILKELELWEASLVSEPMNPEAQVLEVKGATPYQNLQLASRDRTWKATEAVKKVRRQTDSLDAPSSDYKKAFLWYDSDKSDNFTAYKLPYADVIDGKLTAVPRAIFNAAARLNQTDIPEADKAKVANNINKYYKKMGLESPLKSNGELKDEMAWVAEIIAKKIELPEFEAMKDIENFLKEPFPLSGNDRKKLISKIKSFSREADNDGERDVHSEIDQKLDENLISSRLDTINNLLEDK